MRFSLNDIAAITVGKVVQQGIEESQISFFCTDSRKVQHPRNSIYVPLVTEARDGHKFIESAYENGIRCFLVSDKDFKPDVLPMASFILVEDTLAAMQQIATAHRANFNIEVFGVTGSNGKTIVKEWLSILLSNHETVVKNPKSYNSQIGVPLSISAIKEQHTFGIFEAGISHPGEMERLQKIIQPTLGIFTTIGEAHAANFSNQEEKIKEKLKLFGQVGKLYYRIDHEEINKVVSKEWSAQNPQVKLRTWGHHEQADLRITNQKRVQNSTLIEAVFNGENVSLELPYADEAYVENALHCYFVLLDMGYEATEIAPWFLNLPPIQMRLELIKGIHNCTIINDTYSLDLASLNIALHFLDEQVQHKKHSLILSDILQHGKSDLVYNDIIKMLQEQELHRIILIGEETKNQFNLFQCKLEIDISHYDNASDFLEQMNFDEFQDEAILIKGARRYALERIVNRLEQNIHRTILSINLSALLHNANVFRRRLSPNTKIMAMVKAFSYGSGSYEVASALEHYGIDYLSVAYVDEGILLRRKGVQSPILILNPELDSLDAMLRYNLEPEVYSLNLLKQFDERMRHLPHKLKIHIKLDTGMHRLGIEEKNLEDFLSFFHKTDSFIVKSVFSHLVGSDNIEFSEFTEQQKESFVRMSARIEQSIGYPVIKHISNSGGTSADSGLEMDMVRLGIGLYGIDNRPSVQKELQQISSLKTSISQIKKLDATETVGYSRAGVLDKETTIATLNIGYADGYSRAFSKGKGKVLINGKLAPVVGNVCMDMIMVDVSEINNVAEGDEAIIFGPELPVSQLAEWIGTIPYEVIAGISQRVKRIFYKE